VAVLPELPATRRTLAVAALGDARGPAGPAALRGVLSTEKHEDPVCAALLALAKRCGPDASADLFATLSHRSGAVKDYALLGLAGAGDGRACDAVFARLRQLLARADRRSADVHQPAVAAAVCYLGRHLDDTGCTRLAELLRRRWDRLGEGEREWLGGVWPELRGRPDPEVLREWVRRPLFEPLY
jgi:hypothetical protein